MCVYHYASTSSFPLRCCFVALLIYITKSVAAAVVHVAVAVDIAAAAVHSCFLVLKPLHL
jgi:hypothetical protein